MYDYVNGKSYFRFRRIIKGRIPDTPLTDAEFHQLRSYDKRFFKKVNYLQNE